MAKKSTIKELIVKIKKQDEELEKARKSIPEKEAKLKELKIELLESAQKEYEFGLQEIVELMKSFSGKEDSDEKQDSQDKEEESSKKDEPVKNDNGFVE